MMRIGLAVLVVLLLAGGRANANSCGLLGEPCCPGTPATCSTGVCNPNDFSGCCPLVWLGGGDGGAASGCLTWLGGGDGGAAEIPFCPGTCVQPTATPTSTATPTATPTSTATATPTPHGLADTDPCNDSRQCNSALCNGGVCAERNPAPAVSNNTAVFIGTALLLAGLWSVRRVARRR